MQKGRGGPGGFGMRSHWVGRACSELSLTVLQKKGLGEPLELELGPSRSHFAHKRAAPGLDQTPDAATPGSVGSRGQGHTCVTHLSLAPSYNSSVYTVWKGELGVSGGALTLARSGRSEDAKPWLRLGPLPSLPLCGQLGLRHSSPVSSRVRSHPVLTPNLDICQASGALEQT